MIPNYGEGWSVAIGPSLTPRGMLVTITSGRLTVELRGRWAARFGWDNDVGEQIEADLGFGWVRCWVTGIEMTSGEGISRVVLVADDTQVALDAFQVSRRG